MESTQPNNSVSQIIVTLEDERTANKISRVIKMLKGVVAVRKADIRDDKHIKPTIWRDIVKARREHVRGETIRCNSNQELQQYLDNL